MSSNPLTISAPDGVPYVDITREFDYPVAAVFRAHIEPELVEQWLGPHGYVMKTHHYDARTGGSYHYTHVRPDGESFEFRGMFHVVRANELIVQTFEYLGYPDEVSLEKATFTALPDGRTRLTGRSVFTTQETRDAMVESGMERGVNQGFERLTALLGAK